jgi:hypothetical protein
MALLNLLYNAAIAFVIAGAIVILLHDFRKEK